MRRHCLLGALGGALLFGLVACETTSESPSAETAVATPAPQDDTFADRQARLSAYRAEFAGNVRRLYRAATEVNVSDGVQEREAWILANAYLQAWVDDSALVIEMKQSPLFWIAENMSGATEGPGPTIQVHKENGSIKRRGSLQLVWPESFRDNL